ncbi:hypothetical protein BT96DRAFT_1013000 [Gymnopus androsaceus JB14]|uniref:Uncharacterized protein n=1 Tax=Gymnopus androsaceus JB14 TaxID=1447944 RepID=A0A6A4IE35_9AGAR|nr:hypothetical protein BT96DRAFT_1013000 [Gymnopus androsaceus JB14]
MGHALLTLFKLYHIDANPEHGSLASAKGKIKGKIKILIFKAVSVQRLQPSRADFYRFARTFLPRFEPPIERELLVCYYDRWRRSGIPEGFSKKQTPHLISVYDSEADEHKVKPSRIFFPTRAVSYEDENQCSQTEFCTANEGDEARLNELIKVVEASGGRLDTNKLSFGCMVHGMLQKY